MLIGLRYLCFSLKSICPSQTLLLSASRHFLVHSNNTVFLFLFDSYQRQHLLEEVFAAYEANTILLQVAMIMLQVILVLTILLRSNSIEVVLNSYRILCLVSSSLNVLYILFVSWIVCSYSSVRGLF